MSLKFDEKFKLSDLEPVTAPNTDKVFKGKILDSSFDYYGSDATKTSLCKTLGQKISNSQDVSVQSFKWNNDFNTLVVYKEQNGQIDNKPSYVYMDLNKLTEKDMVFNDVKKPYLANREATIKIYNPKRQFEFYASLFDYVDGACYEEYLKQHPDKKDIVHDKLIDVLIDLKNTKIDAKTKANAYCNGNQLFNKSFKRLKDQFNEQSKRLNEVLEKSEIADNDKEYVDFYKSLKAPNIKDLKYDVSLTPWTNIDFIFITPNDKLVLQAPSVISYNLPSTFLYNLNYHIHLDKRQINKFLNSCTKSELDCVYAKFYTYYMRNLAWYLEEVAQENERIAKNLANGYHFSYKKIAKEIMTNLYDTLKVANDFIKEKENITLATR